MTRLVLALVLALVSVSASSAPIPTPPQPQSIPAGGRPAVQVGDIVLVRMVNSQTSHTGTITLGLGGVVMFSDVGGGGCRWSDIVLTTDASGKPILYWSVIGTVK